MKILPSMASAMSGSFRGITASHNKGGAYFRGRTIPTNPSSSLQVVMRGALSTLMTMWNSVLTQTDRDMWNDWAAQVSWVDSLGQTIQLSGVNMFVRINSVIIQGNSILSLGLSIVTTPPPVAALGLAPAIDTVEVTHVTGPPETVNLSTTLTNAGDFGIQLVLVWVSPNINPGKSYYKGPFTLAGVFDPTAGPTFVVQLSDTLTPGDPWQARYGAAVVGQKLAGYMRSIDSLGNMSGRVYFDAGLIPVAS